MAASDEPIIYAGAMLISMMLLAVAVSVSGSVLQDSYDLMEINHVRYQSVGATYDLVSQEQNYNMTRTEFWSEVDQVPSTDQCAYNSPPQQITYLGDTPDTINTTEMNVTADYRGKISGCRVPGGLEYVMAIEYLIPSLAVSINNPGALGDPGRWELIKTFPN